MVKIPKEEKELLNIYILIMGKDTLDNRVDCIFYRKLVKYLKKDK